MQAGNKVEHSQAFSLLKKVGSTLPDQSTREHLSALDSYLYRAIEPILSSNFDAYLLKLLGWQWYNHRRKVSHHSKEYFSELALRYLALPTLESKVEMLPKLKLDRLVLFSYANLFASIELDPEPKVGARPKLCSLLLAYEEDYRMLGKQRESAYWLSKASNYKHQLCCKYVRLAIKTARLDYSTHQSYTLDDWCLAYVGAVYRAIDKCDWEQGSLPPMVAKYLLTAKQQLRPHLKETSSKYTDDSAHKEPVVNSEVDANTQSWRRALKVLDPTGVVHAANCLEHYSQPIWS